MKLIAFKHNIFQSIFLILILNSCQQTKPLANSDSFPLNEITISKIQQGYNNKEYTVKKIVTLCPHCFNTIKNEYPELGGNYEVMHHTQLLAEFIKQGKIKSKKLNQKITYHDSCYLGRGNKIYKAPRTIINSITDDLSEMKRNKENGLCCGASSATLSPKLNLRLVSFKLTLEERVLPAAPE